MSICEKIRHLCKINSISINKLEKETGITRGSIARWDKNSPSIDKVIPVAEYFGVSVDWIIMDQEKKPIPVSEDGLSNEAKEIIRLYDLASPELRSAALAVLKSAEAVDRVPGDSAKEK